MQKEIVHPEDDQVGEQLDLIQAGHAANEKVPLKKVEKCLEHLVNFSGWNVTQRFFRLIKRGHISLGEDPSFRPGQGKPSNKARFMVVFLIDIAGQSVEMNQMAKR